MNASRRSKVAPTPSLFHASDVRVVMALPLLCLISWLLPQRHWFRACRLLEAFNARVGLFDPKPAAFAAARAFDTMPSRRFAIESAAGRSECHLQVLRSYRPGGWQPSLRLEGSEHIDLALRNRRGCVLWIGHFCFNSLATKMALHRAGYSHWHISRPEHGFSKSRFGMACLNPIRIGAETPFLGGRIEIDRMQPGNALLKARQILADNGIVSMTAGAWEGRNPVDVDLLGGMMKLAAGPAELARHTGAALLPVFTIRQSHAAIKVIVENEIRSPKIGSPRETSHAMAQSFAERLETYVRNTPTEWRDWKNLELSPGEMRRAAEDGSTIRHRP